MSDTGWVNPGTVVSDGTVGTLAWSNPSYATSEDDVFSTVVTSYRDGVYDNAVRIVKSNGTIGTTNLSEGTGWGYGDKVYGSSSNLWGETWSPADINDSDFGFAISVYDGYTSDITEYLKATNFSFSIPDGATIDGIEVKVVREEENNGPIGISYAKVDSIQIKVYYTEPTNTGWVSPGTVSESGTGEAWTDENNVKTDDTSYAYARVGTVVAP